MGAGRSGAGDAQRTIFELIEGGAAGEPEVARSRGPALTFEEAAARGFDLLISNPPFGVAVGDRALLAGYELAHVWHERRPEDADAPAEFVKTPRVSSRAPSEVLFVELLERLARPGGRVVALLCDSLLSNAGMQYVRCFLLDRCRLRSVVSLSNATFKPYTTIKTSVVFFQKFNEEPARGQLCPRHENYSIAMALSRESGRDRSGRLRYVRDEAGAFVPASDIAAVFDSVGRMVAAADDPAATDEEIDAAGEEPTRPAAAPEERLAA